MMLLTILIQAAVPEPVEIVVRAERGKCRLQLADRSISPEKLGTYADAWPKDQPVRVVSPKGARYKCLARLTFALSGRGIRSVEFVDAP